MDDPRDKRTVLPSKIAHLLARPAADLHVTKTLFLETDAATKKPFESNSKSWFTHRRALPKGVHQVYRLLLSGLLHFYRKACVESFNLQVPLMLMLISTYPCKKIWGTEKDLDNEEARLACANLYFHSSRSAVSQFFTCLVGHMNGLFKLVAPSQW